MLSPWCGMLLMGFDRVGLWRMKAINVASIIRAMKRMMYLR